MSVELTPEGRAARNAYRRELYARNAEREKERQTEFWNRKGERLAAARKEKEHG